MLFNELKERVAHLGFERMIEDDAQLKSAAKNALSILFTDRPQVAVARIYISSPLLTRVYKAVKHRGGATEELSLVGAAFSFLPQGDGSYSLIRGETATRVNFTAASGIQKGLIPDGAATIRFEGSRDYTLTNLATFDGVFSSDLTDVPEYTEQKVIDPSDHIGDLLAPASIPKHPSGKEASEARIAYGKLILPFSFEGELCFDYYRRPMGVEGEELDVPMGLEHLFALLTAAFVWLDDDPEKAQYYMALYRDGIRSVNAASRFERHAEYITNGWA